MGKWHPAVIAIRGYQKYISPHKGFCCAYRVASGDVSCSEFARLSIVDNGLISSFRSILQRFAECKQAVIYLSEQKKMESKNKNSQKKSDSCASDMLGCAPFSCVDVPAGCAVGGAASGGCDACACTPF